jgi:Ni/Fe-hydrogenase subunit HybB-like protein
MAFGGVVGLWCALSGSLGVHPSLLLLAVIALGAGTAGYSAFLFAQCEGRDFWQSPLLLPHLLAQAVVAGAGALMMYANFTGSDVPENLDTWLSAGLILHLLMIMGEIAVPHTNRDSALAAAHITTKRRSIFWWLAMGVGIVMPLGLVALVGDAAYGLAGVLALGGLYVYEHLWVEAGQSVALS